MGRGTPDVITRNSPISHTPTIPSATVTNEAPASDIERTGAVNEQRTRLDAVVESNSNKRNTPAGVKISVMKNTRVQVSVLPECDHYSF